MADPGPAGHRPAGSRAGELATIRLVAGAELVAALRQLRDDSDARLSRPDPHYPAALAAAVAELGRRYHRRVTELTDHLPGPAAEASAPGWWVPPVGLPSRQGRWSAEVQLLALAGVSAGAGLARLAWIGGPPPPALAALAAAAATGLACWLGSARRAAAERARLGRWTARVLADTRAALDLACARHLLLIDRHPPTQPRGDR